MCSACTCAKCSASSPTQASSCSCTQTGCAIDWPGCTRRSMGSPGQTAQAQLALPPPAIQEAPVGPWQVALTRHSVSQRVAALAAQNGLSVEEALARVQAAFEAPAADPAAAAGEQTTPPTRPSLGITSPTPSPGQHTACSIQHAAVSSKQSSTQHAMQHTALCRADRAAQCTASSKQQAASSKHCH